MSKPLVDFTDLVDGINEARANNRAARQVLEMSSQGEGIIFDYVCEEGLVHIVLSGQGIEILEFSDGLYAAFGNNMKDVVHYVSLNVQAAWAYFVELRNAEMRQALGGGE